MRQMLPRHVLGNIGGQTMQIEEKDGIYSMTHQIIGQIVKEEDEYVMNMISDYVKTEQLKGNFVSSKIIPEGQLRHIINLGLTIFSKQVDYDLHENELFEQEQYIEFLRKQINEYQKENQQLKNEIMQIVGGEEE